MALNIKRLGQNGIQIEPVASTSIDTKGEMEVLNSGAFQFHDGTAARRVLVDNFTGNITITGDLSVTGQATVDNLNLNGNTISSTNVDGGIIIDPNGNGNIDLTVSGSGVINLGSSSITISPSGVMTLTGQLNADNIRIDGNTISSTDTNGDIILDPNGTGNVKVDSLTASLPVKTDASKNLVSGAISLTSEVSGILPVANGGTGSSSQNFVDLTTAQSVGGQKTLTSTPIISTLGTGVVHSDGSGLLSSSNVVNADVDAAAAIDFSKLAALSSGNVLLGNGSNVATSTAVTGDLTISNTGVTAIGSNKVANSQLAQMAAHTIKGNNTGSTANALDLTATQVTAELNAFVGDSGSGGTKGLVPAPSAGDAAAGKFLKADGTFAVPSGGGSVSSTSQEEFEPYIKPSLISVSNTQIINRAQVRSDAATARVIVGDERILSSQLALIQNEFGPNGERVWAPLEDLTNRVRFIGSWSQSNDSNGQAITSSTTNDFIEISFYGTGVALLLRLASASYDLRVTLDGGTEGSNILTGTTSYSAGLAGRNYNPNQIIIATSGQTLGQHTVKIRLNAAVALNVTGFEILNERSDIRVLPGTGVSAGSVYTLASNTDTGFTATFDQIEREGAVVGTIGSRGARVVHYIDPTTGTAKKRAYTTNSAQANLSSASHTYEEIIRSYHWREFGANRSDDFSTLVGTARAAAFTLEDGTTTLVASSIQQFGTIGSNVDSDGLLYNNANDFITFTFIGTGCDVVNSRTTTSGAQYTVFVDGTSVGTSQSFVRGQNKLVSGLPYGTHTVKILATSVAGTQLSPGQFIVYGPKKPTLPSNAVEQSSYYLMADYVANSTAGLDTIGTGVLRKQAGIREAVYINGTGGSNWAISSGSPVVGSYPSGWNSQSNHLNSSVDYQFFGSGFEYRAYVDTDRTPNITVSLNGNTVSTANFSISLNGGAFSGTATFGTITLTTYGGMTFTPSTGNLSINGSFTGGAGFTLKNLSVNSYRLRLNQAASSTANTYLHMTALDIVTPIHSPIASLFDQQNTAPIGSCSLADTRKFSPVQSLQSAQQYRGIAIGVTSSPTTTSTSLIPCPELSLVAPSKGGWFEINSLISCFPSTTSNISFQFYLDGIGVGTERIVTQTSGNYTEVVLSELLYLTSGSHKLDVYWKVSAGTLTANTTMRSLTVKEL